jgi:hypothetical protein
MDHFVVTEKGRFFESREKKPSEQMFGGGCLLYDHASSAICVKFQISQTSAETLQAKLKFEKRCSILVSLFKVIIQIMGLSIPRHL